jgi:hypothetical protein
MAILMLKGELLKGINRFSLNIKGKSFPLLSQNYTPSQVKNKKIPGQCERGPKT